MYAELINGITIDMLNDSKVRIISDTGLFLITSKSNTSNYPNLEFDVATMESLEAYKHELRGFIKF